MKHLLVYYLFFTSKYVKDTQVCVKFIIELCKIHNYETPSGILFFTSKYAKDTQVCVKFIIESG